VERRWQGKVEILGEKPAPVPHVLPQIPHGLPWISYLGLFIWMMCEMQECGNKCVWYDLNFFFLGTTAPSGPGLPHYRGFTIALRHTTLRRTPVDEWSARHRDLYLTTHNTHNWQTSMPPARFEPVIPANKRPHWNRHNFKWALLFCHIWRIWSKQRRTNFHICTVHLAMSKFFFITNWCTRKLF